MRNGAARVQCVGIGVTCRVFQLAATRRGAQPAGRGARRGGCGGVRVAGGGDQRVASRRAELLARRRVSNYRTYYRGTYHADGSARVRSDKEMFARWELRGTYQRAVLWAAVTLPMAQLGLDLPHA